MDIQGQSLYEAFRQAYSSGDRDRAIEKGRIFLNLLDAMDYPATIRQGSRPANTTEARSGSNWRDEKRVEVEAILKELATQAEGGKGTRAP